MQIKIAINIDNEEEGEAPNSEVMFKNAYAKWLRGILENIYTNREELFGDEVEIHDANGQKVGLMKLTCGVTTKL